jgi:hypothetical protein
MTILLLRLAALLFILIRTNGENEPESLSKFSGFYRPDISKNIELFASAWLIPKAKFLASKTAFAGITNFEGTVFSVLGGHGAASKKKAIMTRDYFDFQVEHLSSTLNTLEDTELFSLLEVRLAKRAEALRMLGFNFSKQHSSAALTVAILPFSSASGHAEAAKEQKQKQLLRIRMFVATFWSLKRYNFEVVVSVSSKEEFATLQGLDLPIFRIYTFYDLTRKSQQPKRSLLQAVTDITTDHSWQQFEFVYYSDADQILHMRNLNILYNTLLMDDSSYVLCPHRLHTMALPKDIPKPHRDARHFTISNLAHHTKSSLVIVEKGLNTRGSCCDDGRYFITNTSICNNFWYFCDELHAFTLMEWIKFGPHGFTAPLTTEHLGKCRYFPSRRQCDVPKHCRGESAPAAVLASDGSPICEEIDKAHYF